MKNTLISAFGFLATWVNYFTVGELNEIVSTIVSIIIGIVTVYNLITNKLKKK